jgi:hypothetical protein
MNIGFYLQLAHQSETELANACSSVSDHHRDEPDIRETCWLLAGWSHRKASETRPFMEKYGEKNLQESEPLSRLLFQGPRKGGLALLRDLHDLCLMATEAQMSWTILLQAALALHDLELEAACQSHLGQTQRQISWLHTRMKQAAPQALVVA